MILCFSVLNAGLGLGAGLGIGNQMGNVASQALNANIAPPPIPQTTMYYVAVNGQQQGPFDSNVIIGYIQNGQITADTLVWKNGMPTWAKISTLVEFSNFFGACPPPIPTTL